MMSPLIIKCLGDISVMKAKYKEAEQYYLNSLTICKGLTNGYLKEDVLSVLSYLYIKIKQWDKALSYARQARASAYDTNQILKSYLIMGGTFYNLSQMDSAKYYLHRIVEN